MGWRVWGDAEYRRPQIFLFRLIVSIFAANDEPRITVAWSNDIPPNRLTLALPYPKPLDNPIALI